MVYTDPYPYPPIHSNPKTCQNVCSIHHLSLLQISTGTESDVTAAKYDDHQQKAKKIYFSISDIYIFTILTSRALDSSSKQVFSDTTITNVWA